MKRYSVILLLALAMLFFSGCGEQSTSQQTCFGVTNDCKVINNNGGSSSTSQTMPTSTPTHLHRPTRSATQPTPTEIPPAPTPVPTPQFPATYHITGTWHGKLDDGTPFTRPIFFSFTITKDGTVSGSATLDGNGELLYEGSADQNLNLDFYTQALKYGAYAFEWKGSIQGNTIVNGTVSQNYIYDGTWTGNVQQI